MSCEFKNTIVLRDSDQSNRPSSSPTCALSGFNAMVPESTTASRLTEDAENTQSFDTCPGTIVSGQSWSSMAASIDQRLDCLRLGPPIPAIEGRPCNSLARFENDRGAIHAASHSTNSEIGIGEISNTFTGRSGCDPESFTQSNSPNLRCLPAEIRHQIWKYALTAEENKFEFSDLCEPDFKPNVATGLLRVNREIYHDAFNYLYTENHFIFRDCGSDIRVLAQPRGLLSCRAKGCRTAVNGPFFREVTLVLGDNKSIDIGELKMQHFAAALEGIRCEFKIEKLKVYFRDFCWASKNGPEDLMKGLSRLQVTRTMKMFGADFHWSENLRVIPRALGMNFFPDDWCFAPGTQEVLFKGFFSCDYHPATTPEELEEKEGQVILDAGHAYNEYMSGGG